MAPWSLTQGQHVGESELSVDKMETRQMGTARDKQAQTLESDPTEFVMHKVAKFYTFRTM